ncbi:secondary thiamine-phosphate synthase enzyme YjbQ [Synechococcus sp. PCC 7336]|uniref:secondary thiamine-phosphate synthase enzyme YjbQ n=1 Tax=Synechococcus sp. PCC 7336 TaxID=195250 RepID=UPI00034A3123|nr:secondary thiamine-phosphate synthase enzyme YjbQ [Synechococcus sp. PCC 7336]
MKQYRDSLNIRTSGKSFSPVTSEVAELVEASGIESGICTLFLRHTSASLVIQENADPDVLRDLAAFLARLVPEDGRYTHGMEGPDDMPAHIRTALTSTSEHIPIANGRLMLGTWQGIYVWEHRDRPYTRELLVHAIGE